MPDHVQVVISLHQMLVLQQPPSKPADHVAASHSNSIAKQHVPSKSSAGVADRKQTWCKTGIISLRDLQLQELDSMWLSGDPPHSSTE